MISCLCDILDCVSDRCGTRCGCQCSDTALQCCNSLLEDIRGRIHQSGVNVARLSQSEASCRLCGILEYIRGGCIDRYSSGVCCRICIFLSYVKLKSLKLVILAHGMYLPFHSSITVPLLKIVF